MSTIDDVLAANERYAEEAALQGLGAPPQRQLAILTCMDARIDPARAFGLEPGDAHVIRNAGGRASEDALRSLAVSAHLLGARTILVIHHSKCGMMASDDELRDALSSASGQDVSGMEVLGFEDLDESVREDVGRLREWPVLPDGLDIRGFVFDIETGRLHPVEG